MQKFVNKVKRYIEKFQLFRKGERVLACVSAGLDSIALLKFLTLIQKEYALTIFVSYYDHKIRKESVEDGLFVYRICKEWGIPFFYSASPVPLYAKREKLSLEMAGRELRYNLWYRLCKEFDLHKIVLAHHLDDLVEEIFLRLIRGTGRRGLTGIPIKRENLIVRPFLFVSKDEIREFAITHNLKWREDSTNKDLKFLRNKIRHILIPFLEENFNKKIKENVKKTALFIAEDEELIESLALDKFKEVKIQMENVLALKLPELRVLPVSLRKRIYFIAFKEVNLPLFRVMHKHIEQIENLVTGKGKGPVFLPGNYLVYRGPGYLLFTKKVFQSSYWEVSINKEGEYKLPNEYKVIIKKLENPSDKEEILQNKINNQKVGETVFISGDVAKFPFVLRTRKKGDRVFIKNLGYKKLKKLFQEKQIPSYLRDTIPILEIDKEIVFIPKIYFNPKFVPKSKEKFLWLIKFVKA